MDAALPDDTETWPADAVDDVPVPKLRAPEFASVLLPETMEIFPDVPDTEAPLLIATPPEVPALETDSTTTWPPVVKLLPERMDTEPTLRPLPVCKDKSPLVPDADLPVEIVAAPVEPADDSTELTITAPDSVTPAPLAMRIAPPAAPPRPAMTSTAPPSNESLDAPAFTKTLPALPAA